MFCLLKNIDNVLPEENYFCTNSEINTIIAENDEDDVFIIFNKSIIYRIIYEFK